MDRENEVLDEDLVGENIFNEMCQRAKALSNQSNDGSSCYPWQEESGGEWQNY